MYIREDFDKILSEGFKGNKPSINYNILMEDNNTNKNKENKEVSFDKIRKAVEKGIKARISHGVKIIKYEELEDEEKRTVELVFPAKKYNEIRHSESVAGYDVYYYVRTINNKPEKITSVIAFKHSEKFPYVGIPFKKYLGKTKYENKIGDVDNMDVFNELNSILNDEGIDAEVFNEDKSIGEIITVLRGNGKIKKLVLRPIAGEIANFIVDREDFHRFKVGKKGATAMMNYKSEILTVHRNIIALEFFETAMKNKTVSEYIKSLRSYVYKVSYPSHDYNVNVVSYLNGKALTSNKMKTLLNTLIKDLERFIQNDAKEGKVEKYTAILNDLKRKSEVIYPKAYDKYKKNLEVIKTL